MTPPQSISPGRLDYAAAELRTYNETNLCDGSAVTRLGRSVQCAVVEKQVPLELFYAVGLRHPRADADHAVALIGTYAHQAVHFQSLTNDKRAELSDVLKAAADCCK
jgi:hypothetical protein